MDKHNVPLAHYDLNKKFYLRTDANKKGISAILSQFDKEGHERIISLVNRCLTAHELNYAITELELLAIVYGLMKLQKYLLGIEFKIIIDHFALTFLLKTPFYNSRLARWSALIPNFSFKIISCKGIDNIAADYFSRITAGEIDKKEDKEFVVAAGKTTIQKEKKKLDTCMNSKPGKISLVKFIKSLPDAQEEDEKTKMLYRNLIEGKEIKNYYIKNKLICLKKYSSDKGRALIPDKLRNVVIDKNP